MATVSELVDLDSGVASSDATPEGQTIMAADAEDAAKIALAGDEILEVSKEIEILEVTKEISDAPGAETEVAGKENIVSAPVTIVTTAAASSSDGAVAVVPADDDVEEEEEEDVDESFGERLVALTEMFPDKMRSVSISAVSSSVNLLKGSYNLTRQVVWIAVSSSIILFAPVMFELERLNVEELMKQDRNRLVLGPGSAVSGGVSSTPGGLMPPPPAR